VALARPDPAVTVPMPDHRAVQPRRHHADNNVTMPTKPGSQIGILDECFVCKISARQHLDLIEADSAAQRPLRPTPTAERGMWMETQEPMFDDP